MNTTVCNFFLSSLLKNNQHKVGVLFQLLRNMSFYFRYLHPLTVGYFLHWCQGHWETITGEQHIATGTQHKYRFIFCHYKLVIHYLKFSANRIHFPICILGQDFAWISFLFGGGEYASFYYSP